MFKHIYELAKENHCKISMAVSPGGTLAMSAYDKIPDETAIYNVSDDNFKNNVFQRIYKLAKENDCFICASVDSDGIVYVSVYGITQEFIELPNDWDTETILNNIEDAIKKANEEMEEEEC